jgi:hypothetical protein
VLPFTREATEKLGAGRKNKLESRNVHLNEVLFDYARCTARARKVLMKICLGLAAETLSCREIGRNFYLVHLIVSDGIMEENWVKAFFSTLQ